MTCFARCRDLPSSAAPAAAPRTPPRKAFHCVDWERAAPAALWFLRMAFRLATRLGDGFTGAAFQKPKWPAWKFFAEEVQTCTVAMRLAASCNLFRADPNLRPCHWRRPTAMNALQTSPSGPVPQEGRGIFKWLLICSTPTGTSLFRLLFKAAWTSRRIQSMLPWTQPLATNLAARDESSAAPAISTKLGKMGRWCKTMTRMLSLEPWDWTKAGT